MPVLPVQPGMAKFMREDVTAAGDGEPFSQVNRFQLVVPDAIGVGIATVHLGVRKLSDRDSITERQDHTRRDAHEVPKMIYEDSLPQMAFGLHAETHIEINNLFNIQPSKTLVHPNMVLLALRYPHM